jgi:hypothetical protein
MQNCRQSPSIRPIPTRGYPFSLPGPLEREALGRVAAYLSRAGNEVESRALLPTGPPEADLRALRESLRAAAALCDGMAEMAFGGDGPRQSSQHTNPTWKREATG